MSGIRFNDYSVEGLARMNVLLGKNGSGKSSFLRSLDECVTSGALDAWTKSKYVTPERAGTLVYDIGVESNISANANWLLTNRRANQARDFKQQTISQYRQLELDVLRNVEDASIADQKPTHYFSDFMERINSLLENIEIRRERGPQTLKLHSRDTGELVTADKISSGESELITLAIEASSFALGVTPGDRGLLLLDEPDVHLHPDLQARLVKFLVRLASEFGLDVIIATHSTAILGELSNGADSTVCFQSSKQASLVFDPIDVTYKQLLPVFGAHPLTQVFNETRTLLVEGDDDVRIWQEAVRASQGAIKVTPIGCNGTSDMHSYEQAMQKIVSAVYENGQAYSLRDLDESGQESIDDTPPIIRMRLSCRNAENLMLSDEVLNSVSIDWERAKQRTTAWCAGNEDHSYFPQMKAFIDGGFDRKNYDLKDIRMILLGDVLESRKPWEVLVGKAIGKLRANPGTAGDHSLRAYLGNKTVTTLGI